MIITSETTVPHVNALIVLGRGIELDGTLSPTSEHRSHVAAQLASTAMNHATIVFSGGYSWRQVVAGVTPPSEGQTMLDHTLHLMGLDEAPDNMRAENVSNSTLENFTASAPLLELEKGDTLGVLSDPLHHMFGRPKSLAKRAFPGVHVIPMSLPKVEAPSKAEITEELKITLATAAFMTGIHKGDLEGMMRRQRKLEELNAKRADPFEDKKMPSINN